jgi:hypothetical protein
MACRKAPWNRSTWLNRYRVCVLFLAISCMGCAIQEPSISDEGHEQAEFKGQLRSKLLPSSKIGSTPFGTGFDPRAKQIEKSLGL